MLLLENDDSCNYVFVYTLLGVGQNNRDETTGTYSNNRSEVYDVDVHQLMKNKMSALYSIDQSNHL